jgi:shikimate dehydrogenase
MERAFRRMGLDARYTALSSLPESLEKSVLSMRRTHSGFNVTMPFKRRVVQLVDRLDDQASMVGAVNTVKNERGTLTGYNTDVEGVFVPLFRLRRRPTRALLIGAGGAARAFCAAADRLRCCDITVAVRDTSKGREFASEMRASFSSVDLHVVELADAPRAEYDLIFNGSPIGSKAPLPRALAEAVTPGAVVFDAVYLPVETELLSVASRRGCTVIHGYEMLIHQAIGSLLVWLGAAPEESEMRADFITRLGVVA